MNISVKIFFILSASLSPSSWHIFFEFLGENHSWSTSLAVCAILLTLSTTVSFLLIFQTAKITLLSKRKDILWFMLPLIPHLVSVWWRGPCSPNNWKSHSAPNCRAFPFFNKITVQLLRQHLNCWAPEDPMFSFSLSLSLSFSLSVSVSKTRGSPWLLLRLSQGRGGFMWGKGSLQETFGGSQLPCALWSVAYEHWKKCMCERRAFHAGGIWPKFNLSIVRMEG